VDTPAALYQRPRNTFVASFIGTPPMNLIEGEISGGESPRFRASEGQFQLTLERTGAPAVSGGASRRVVLGVRPEDLAIAAPGRLNQGGGVPARVELVELLGGEALLHLDSGGVDLTARVPAPLLVSGSDLTLIVPLDRIHLFDGETRERLGD
jgi:ABC-type sugar transport system ATPase subunit